MTTTPKKQIAIFPDMPRDKYIIDKSGEINPLWDLFFQQLTAALQQNLKPEGFVIPVLTATEIASLTGTASHNNIVYDSTNNLFKGNENGTWKTFTLT